MLNFFIENFQYLIEILGIVIAYILGTKSRKMKLKESEFSNYQKKLENFEKEFNIKSEMLDNLKKDFDYRVDFLSDKNVQLEENRVKLEKIILDQSLFIEKQNEKIKEYVALLNVK